MTARSSSRISPSPGLDWRLGASFFLGGALVSAVAYPLLTYTVSLAMFGLAHVLSEMRYVRARFGGSLARWLAGTIALILAGVVSLRVAIILGALDSSLAINLELGLIGVLALLTLPVIWRSSKPGFIASCALCATLFGGLLISPIHTLLALAVLHNLTPVGFLLEVVPAARRRLVILASGALFVGAPLLIASGLPAHILSLAGLDAPDFTLLPSGPLSANLGAYLPREWHGMAFARHAFSAIVFTQLLHYAAVIHVLPRLLPQDPDARAGESERRAYTAFLVALVGLGAILFVYFCFDFKQARAIYGVAAAVHAWIEIPILMIALSAMLGARAGSE